ncbi:MAG TPA: hypothetical protein VIU46_03280 [Gallionellaceae bacterium]
MHIPTPDSGQETQSAPSGLRKNIIRAALRAMPGRPRYSNFEGMPFLSYTPGTIVLLEYWYDFEQKRWRLVLD